MNQQPITYNAQHFIDKFTAIPEEKWCIKMFTDEHGRHCAAGHCDKKN